jgi:nicotinamide riboside transporter PnuC
MRFAWQRKNSTSFVPVKQSFTNRLLYIAYNVVWWIPIVLAFTKTIDYRTGFIAFFVVTIIRAGANLLRNNVLKPEQAENFPLRSV